ncbi:hypothetical protein ABIF81_001641 [Bradyrhizobium daqingense]
MFEVILTRRKRFGWRWQVCDQSGKVFADGFERTRAVRQISRRARLVLPVVAGLSAQPLRGLERGLAAFLRVHPRSPGERSDTRDGAGRIPDVAALIRATRLCVARRAKHARAESTCTVENIPLYRNSETAYVSPQPGPTKRGVSRSSRTRAGRRWDVDHTGAKGFAGRATVSESVAPTTGAVRVRQNRVVLASGVCTPSLAVMRRPDRVRSISHPQGDGGNSASLPGESTTYAVNPLRREGRLLGFTCMPLCNLCKHTLSHSGPWVPGRHPVFPAPFFNRG